jgi:TonB family protein
VGKKAFLVRLRSQPTQKFGIVPQTPEDAALMACDSSLEDPVSAVSCINHLGNGITAPIVLNFPAAQFSDEARRAKYQGDCILSLVVDTRGMPKNIRVVKPLGYGLTEKAIEVVSQYRFKPAMKDGTLVPVRVDVEVAFHLY